MTKRLFSLLSVCLALASCEVRVSDNGDLDGLWQLTSLDSLPGGTHADMRSSGEYWAVQVHLLEVRNHRGLHDGVLFRFRFTGDSLHLRQPYADVSGGQEPLPPHDVSALAPFGISRTDESFRVLRLSSSEMVLCRHDGVRLSLRKY